MKAFIYTGGCIVPENISERAGEGDLVIAADSGYRNARLMGVSPSVAVGDFDSLARDEQSFSSDTKVIRLPAEKDLSDTQAAVNIALERGADEIVIIGGLDGRLDHTMANMLVVEELTKKGIVATITDGRNRVRFLSSSSVLILRENFKYLSIVPTVDTLKKVDVKGCKYPLKRATLLRSDPSFAISNEIVENCAFVSIGRGSAYIIESNDKK